MLVAFAARTRGARRMTAKRTPWQPIAARAALAPALAAAWGMFALTDRGGGSIAPRRAASSGAMNEGLLTRA